MNGALMNNVEFKGGRGYCHATALENLIQSTMAKLAPHEHNMDGGVLNSNLKPVVQANERSKKPMVKVWAIPWERWPNCIFHVYMNHRESLMRSNGWIALILIARDDPRMNEFVQFRAGGRWARKCHPAYTANITTDWCTLTAEERRSWSQTAAMENDTTILSINHSLYLSKLTDIEPTNTKPFFVLTTS